MRILATFLATGQRPWRSGRPGRPPGLPFKPWLASPFSCTRKVWLRISERTALLSVHFRLSVAHLSRRWMSSLMLPPTTTQVASSTKEMPRLPATLRMDLGDADRKESGRYGGPWPGGV